MDKCFINKQDRHVLRINSDTNTIESKLDDLQINPDIDILTRTCFSTWDEFSWSRTYKLPIIARFHNSVLHIDARCEGAEEIVEHAWLDRIWYADRKDRGNNFVSALIPCTKPLYWMLPKDTRGAYRIYLKFRTGGLYTEDFAFKGNGGTICRGNIEYSNLEDSFNVYLPPNPYC